MKLHLYRNTPYYMLPETADFFDPMDFTVKAIDYIDTRLNVEYTCPEISISAAYYRSGGRIVIKECQGGITLVAGLGNNNTEEPRELRDIPVDHDIFREGDYLFLQFPFTVSANIQTALDTLDTYLDAHPGLLVSERILLRMVNETGGKPGSSPSDFSFQLCLRLG